MQQGGYFPQPQDAFQFPQVLKAKVSSFKGFAIRSTLSGHISADIFTFTHSRELEALDIFMAIFLLPGGENPQLK